MNESTKGLLDQIQQADDRLKDAKATRSDLQAELERRFLDGGLMLLETTNGIGTSHNVQDGCNITTQVSKKVKWDSEMLMEIAGGMEWKTAKDLFNIEFSMSEKSFSALTGNLRSSVEGARTIFLQKPKVTIKGVV
tara:strand:+ start:1171 stop:1578 length:408 start_codon:yes stop_codon:yes gene_type:complete